MNYTINKVAKIAGITLRALRYYDKIGLLVPSARSEAGYRLYSDADIEKLQQILFFKELDFSLEKIGEMINNPNFERKKALELQVEFLEKRAQRYLNLSQLAKKTLISLERGDIMKKQDMFKEFDYDKMMEEQKTYEKEVKERWGNSDAYKISKERTDSYTKNDWEKINEVQMNNYKELCDLFKANIPYDDERVLKVVEKCHKFITDNFYPCSLEIFSNLGNMYVMDERFTAYYEKLAKGLAEYYNEAIQHYCIINS